MTKREAQCLRIRRHLVRMTTAAGSGHLTSSLSAVELMTVLMFSGFYKKGDRLIFSKGHAAPLLYALCAERGDIAEKELLTLRKFGSRLEGHPMMTFPFIEAPTGSLGQGLSIGLGMAIANALDKKRKRVFVLLGDGEMAEGSVWEAIHFAGVQKVQGLVAVLDMNRLGQSAPTALGHNAAAYARRFAAFGWKTAITNGHDTYLIAKTYRGMFRGKGPIAIIAKTVKGKGIRMMENTNGWHGKVLTNEQAKKAMGELS